MKGICHTWSKGQDSSLSLPENRRLKFGSQKISLGRNPREHRLVRRIQFEHAQFPITEFFIVFAFFTNPVILFFLGGYLH